MTTTATTTAQTRTLLGCPPWCTFDHLNGPSTDPGEHIRDLARLGSHDVDLGCTAYDPEPEVVVSLGGNESLRLPATGGTVEELRDIAAMLSLAADELSGLVLSGELEARA